MDLESLENNYISRIVAFVVTPILVPGAAAVAAWLQDAIGINLSGAQLTAYVVAVAAGVAIGCATWLRNRGEWEKAQAELIKLYDLGSTALTGTAGSFEVTSSTPPGATSDPTTPPGIR